MSIEIPLCLTVSNTVSFHGRKKEETEKFDYLADLHDKRHLRHCITMESFKAGRYSRYSYEFKLLNLETGNYDYTERREMNKKEYENQKENWLDIPHSEEKSTVIGTTHVKILYFT